MWRCSYIVVEGSFLFPRVAPSSREHPPLLEGALLFPRAFSFFMRALPSSRRVLPLTEGVFSHTTRTKTKAITIPGGEHVAENKVSISDDLHSSELIESKWYLFVLLFTRGQEILLGVPLERQGRQS